MGVRRIACALFALALLHQSSGIALAAGAGMAQPGLSIRAQIAAAVQSLQNTQIGAAVSGNEARWNAMHAPPPVIQHQAPAAVVAPDRHVNDARQFRYGVFVTAPRMLRPPLSSKEAPKDPRAMRQPPTLPILAPPAKPCVIGRICAPALNRKSSIRTMAITPTVQPFLFEADTTAGPSTPVFYTDGGKETGALSQTMDSAPANTAANETLSYAASTPAVSFGWVSPANVPNSTSWPAQTYTVTLHVTQANSNLVITAVHVLRVDASGDGGGSDEGLAIVGETTGLSQALTAGTLTFTVSGAAQTANLTDRLAVKIVLHNNAASTQSFSYLAGQNSGSGVNLGNAPALGASTTGVNPWWTYEEGTLPGHGKYMINVGNGNVLVQSNDVDVPERGVDLAFRRTYNAQSAHDSNNTDGSVPGDYGDGWTNTFDAHLAYDGANTISVYDIDGARYDYSADGTGHWTAPAGQHATLTWDGGCGYEWTKKSGTIYYFYSPDMNESAACSQHYPSNAAYGGRLYQILGRNQNNSITLTYAWLNGDSSNPSNLTQVNATHADGHALVLNFGAAVTGGPTELLSLTRPDGQIINYYYDSSGANLQWVNRPGNNAASVLKESYGYNAAHQLYYATSPRYNLSTSDGDVTYFSYDSSNRLIKVNDWGLVNFEPNDGTSTYLQAPTPASTPLQTWRVVNFSGYGTGSTTMTDNDGHSAIWSADSLGRVTQTQEYTGETTPTYLVTSQIWDSNNNLTETIDPRSYATDYAYDANGNTTEVALPSVSVLVNGVSETFRPTSLYSYDSFNNVTTYCDPVETNSLSKNWNANPGITGDSVCPSQAGAQRLTWNYGDTYEPYGYLTDMKTAAYGSGSTSDPGYHIQWTYSAAAEGGGDYGLPTSVAGDQFTQQNGASVHPVQSLAYDSHGNLTCYSKLTDANGTHWWRLTYDGLNRQTAVADPDDASLSVSQCSNTAGISGSHIVASTTYYADGDAASTQSPSEYAAGVSTAFDYDADGDQTSKTTHYNCTPSSCTAGVTTNWYDGEDRLVEVQYPHDSTDYYSFAWLTRYLYDLSNGGTVSVAGSGTFKAYGNLYDTREWLPSPTCSGWTDLKGAAYDGLDRTVTRYAYGAVPPAVNCGNGLEKTTLAYDKSAATYGQLATKTDPLNQVATYAYNADAHLASTTYSGDSGVTPAEYPSYDADGRVAAMQSSTLSTEHYAYDTDGRLSQVIEPSGLSAAATLTYGYYSNGWRQNISVSSSALTQSNLMQYNYTNDGQQLNATAAYGGTTAQVGWTQTPAGRVLTMTNSAGSTRQMGYDPQGRLKSDSGGPGAPYGAFSYDDEGEPLSYTAFAQTVTQNFTVRGEFRKQSFSSMSPSGNCQLPGTQWQGQDQAIADGFPVSFSLMSQGQQYCWSDIASFDALNGVSTGAGVAGSGNGTTYSYDNAGRQSAATQEMSGQVCQGQVCQPYDDYGSYTKQYDAENHLIGQTYSAWPVMFGTPACPAFAGSAPNKTPHQLTFTLTYVWGPNGHPVEAKNTATAGNETLHWDADSVLFTTNASGVLDDIKLEGEANITISGGTSTVSFDNRDFTGAEGDPPSPTRQLCNTTSGDYIFSPGRDGISDGYNQFQGVRNYDPVTGTWSTPDAYQGDVRDPMSQHAYMWDRNNSILYEDPSGYDSFPGGTGGLDKKLWHKIPNPNPTRNRGQGTEWYQNNRDKSIVRFDPPTSPMAAPHWHAWRPADSRSRSQPGGQPLGSPMRDANGRAQHQFLPGQNSPDFINDPAAYNCACGNFQFDIDVPDSNGAAGTDSGPVPIDGNAP